MVTFAVACGSLSHRRALELGGAEGHEYDTVRGGWMVEVEIDATQGKMTCGRTGVGTQYESAPMYEYVTPSGRRFVGGGGGPSDPDVINPAG